MEQPELVSEILSSTGGTSETPFSGVVGNWGFFRPRNPLFPIQGILTPLQLDREELGP